MALVEHGGGLRRHVWLPILEYQRMMEGTSPGAIMSWLRQDGQQVDNAEQATALRKDCPGHDPNLRWRLCAQAGSLWAALYPGFILE